LGDLSYWLGFRIDFVLSRNNDFVESISVSTAPQNVPTPSRLIGAETFPVGSRQVIDYANTLTVRTAPRNNSQILTHVHRGDEFEILAFSNRFVQIKTPRGYGWIFAGFLSRTLTASAPVFIPPPQPTGIIGRWTFEKMTESHQLNGAETEIPCIFAGWLYPTLRVFPDNTFRMVIYGSLEGYLVQQDEFLFEITDKTAFAEGETWRPLDNRWLRYFPETGLLRYSFFNPFSYVYVHYYFARV
jgi:hypothetical protein